MLKETRFDYIKIVADSLVDIYGSTLKEYGTDVTMATDVVRRLSDYLYFKKPSAANKKDFEEWKANRDPCNQKPVEYKG